MTVHWKDKRYLVADQLIQSHRSFSCSRYPLVGRFLPLIGVIFCPVEAALKCTATFSVYSCNNLLSVFYHHV